MTAEPFGAGLRGQDSLRSFEKILAGMIEVVMFNNTATR